MNIETQNREIWDRFKSSGVTGRGIIFAVLDTGVTENRRLMGKVCYGKSQGTRDTYGHGTMVAGILIEGCPDAEILSYCVLPNNYGTAAYINSALLDVLERAKKDREHQYIVNMSLGGVYPENAPGVPEMEALIDSLTRLNVPVVCAAGNDGKEEPDTVPGGFASPYTASAATATGRWAEFSTLYDEVDFIDHGHHVETMDQDGFIVKVNGTSFACPNLAVKCALLHSEAMEQGKRLTDAELYAALKESAMDLGEPGRDPLYGWGYCAIAPKEKAEAPSVVDTGLSWPSGRGNRRTTTDHIQIHHTVGDYGTPEKWEKLHKSKQKDGQRGVPYSYLVLEDGTVYLGRGMEYSHGGTKDSMTKNANQRSVAIALNGDMRKDSLPTDKQLAAAIKLTNKIRAIYGLPVGAVLGHKEVPYYVDGKKKNYPTECPSMDMNAFRSLLEGTLPEPVKPEPAPVPSPEKPKTEYPYYAVYSGSTYVNLRESPSGNVIGKVARDARVVVLDRKETGGRSWVEVVLLGLEPVRGWCIPDYLKAEG